jgi:hypothetical protein
LIGAKIKYLAIAHGVLSPFWFSIAWFILYDVVIGVYTARVNGANIGHVVK